jgi:hypothetical protein
MTAPRHRHAHRLAATHRMSVSPPVLLRPARRRLAHAGPPPVLLNAQCSRFLAIERALRAGEATFASMREACGCSAATLKRDLKTMRQALGCPIVFDRFQQRYRLLERSWPGLAPVILEELKASAVRVCP